MKRCTKKRSLVNGEQEGTVDQLKKKHRSSSKSTETELSEVESEKLECGVSKSVAMKTSINHLMIRFPKSRRRWLSSMVSNMIKSIQKLRPLPLPQPQSMNTEQEKPPSWYYWPQQPTWPYYWPHATPQSYTIPQTSAQQFLTYPAPDGAQPENLAIYPPSSWIISSFLIIFIVFSYTSS